MYDHKTNQDTDGNKSQMLNTGGSVQPLKLENTLVLMDKKVSAPDVPVHKNRERSQSDLKRPNMAMAEENRSKMISPASQNVADFGGAGDRGNAQINPITPLSIDLLKVTEMKAHKRNTESHQSVAKSMSDKNEKLVESEELV